MNAPEDDHLALIGDLQRQVVAKDHELLGLRKGTSQAQGLAVRAQRTLQQALSKWAAPPSAIPLELKRDVFRAWSASARGGDVRQEKLEREFKKRLGKSRAVLQSKINAVVGGLAQATHAQQARTVMEAWRSVSKEGKFQKEKSKMKQAQVQQTLMHWMGDLKKTIQPTVFFAWRRLVEARRQEKRAADLRREHARLAKDEAKKRMIQATLALTGDPDKMDPTTLKVVLRAWRECMLESRSENALKFERARAAEREKDRKVQAQRRFAMLAAEGSRPMLHGSFHAWAHKVASRKSEAKRCEEETRFSYLQAIFRAWATLAAAGHQSKELEQEKERLRQEQEQLKKEIEEQRLRQSKIRQSMLGFAENQANQYVILGMIWSSWKELLLEKRLLAEHNAERQQWEREFEERQEAERKSLRYRASVMALSSVDHQMKAQKEVLVPILWAAWKDLVAERRRDETMDISRRAVEDDARKAQQEDRTLAQEAAKLRETYRHSQQQRQAVFLWSIERRDQSMLLRVAWSAWRECLDDRRKTEVEHVQTLKQRLHGTDFAAKIAAVASEQTPTGATAGPTRPGDVAVPVKPGLCGRFFRFFVAPKQPPKQSGRPVWTPTAAKATSSPAGRQPVQVPGSVPAAAERHAPPPTVTQDAAAAGASSATAPAATDPGPSAGPETLPAGEFLSPGAPPREPATPTAKSGLRRFEVTPEAGIAVPLDP